MRRVWMFLILIFSVHFLESGELKSKKHNLSICAIFKNEARYLKEWIEYHRLVGVDHFYLYNNESADRYKEVLRTYEKQGLITLIQWPDLLARQNKDKDEMWALCTQIPAYENAARYRALGKTKWLVFVNVDEFLVPPHTGKLTEILEKYDAYPAVTLLSNFFDASKVNPALPRRRLIIETVELTHRPFQVLEKTVEKTIFKPELTNGFTWPPYTYRFKDDQTPIVLRKQELRINQYVNRNTGYRGKVKEKLPLDNRSLSERETSELLEKYEIEDRECAIYRFVPEVFKRMGYPVWN